MTVATILLFCAVCAYVLLNNESITLLREQFACQEILFVDFGLKLNEAEAPSVWAANLGASSLVVSGVNIRTQQRSTPHRCLVRVIVPAGNAESKIPFDDRVLTLSGRTRSCISTFR
jgi:hypothetical protein